ncbi:MAG: hypothetical protein K5858_06955 [Lachnospiraceae bacterium]|jgi:ABC-type nickel/cobalt efflux system permease component RcnA|nr:hypothetical protein [Lachnospiraceae bacterium]
MAVSGLLMFILGILVFLLVIGFGVFVFWSLLSDEGKRTYHTNRMEEDKAKEEKDNIEYLKDELNGKQKKSLQLDSWVAGREHWNKTRRI